MTVQATFCATLVDEWVRAGITDAVVCPGSRSTPLALALAADDRMRVHVRLDERSAGFVAVGLASATGRPALVLSTSGTAAVELHPAVVEAHHGGVPLLVCTADRPPELQHVGAPQTIDQTRLFADAIRWAVSPGVPDDGARSTWRSLGARAVIEATSRPGPVHLNLAFREPLTGAPDELPAGRVLGDPWHRRRPSPSAPVGQVSGRGVIVAGGGCGPPEAVHELARRLGWPVLADPRSGCRLARQSTIAAADAMLRSWRPPVEPEVVLRIGDAWASKIVNGWLASLDAVQLVVDPHRRWIDPDHTAAVILDALPKPVGDPPRPQWLQAWRAADDAAQAAIDAVLARHDEPNEPGLARSLVADMPRESTLVVSSSMPIREVEWFSRARSGIRVLANRGANGIDGVLSTAVGVALADPNRPTTCLLGDLAFLHDVSALSSGVPANLSIVVADNRGGGIFSFLPQAELIDSARFEQLFGTPHELDLDVVARGFGVDIRVVRTDRTANVALHDEIHSAVADALVALPSAP